MQFLEDAVQTVTIFSDCTGPFEMDLVGNPVDWFSLVAAHMVHNIVCNVYVDSLDMWLVRPVDMFIAKTEVFISNQLPGPILVVIGRLAASQLSR